MQERLYCLQGAWFVVKAYPQHCDTLAFMHGVNEYRKERQAADASAPPTDA